MKEVEREIFRRLGGVGLRRVLADLLDQKRLIKLANACGLRYPGMRTQSQKRDRILRDLAEKAEREEAARRTIQRVLTKESGQALRDWSALDPSARAARLADEKVLGSAGGLGLHLFLAALSQEPEIDEPLSALLSRCESEDSPKVTAQDAEEAVGREVARLKKRLVEFQNKLQHLDGQLVKSREIEKTLKRELMQRKGELAESRMLAERLRREIQEQQATPGAAVAPPASTTPGRPPGSAADPDTLAKTVRKLIQEQRSLTHALEKLTASAPAPPEVPLESLAPILDAVESLRKDTILTRKERRKEEQETERMLEEVRTEVRALRRAADAGAGPQRPPRRRKGEPARVGVFIDVQNVYYAARQLKGKLDFDALLHAVVRDRRLIQARAYVVESQEIDQSGFIAMLQQRNIEVRRKTLKIRSDGSMKGDWDMEMALEILDEVPRLDVVVLVSGDGDFTSLVNRVKGMGPRVEVAAFPRNTAKSLLEAADEFQPLDRKFMIRTPDASAAREGRDAPLPPPIAKAPAGEEEESTPAGISR